jgi:hypothetical protein
MENQGNKQKILDTVHKIQTFRAPLDKKDPKEKKKEVT